MQAFIAGVEYADRAMRSPEARALKEVADSLRRRSKAIDEQMVQFVPIARPRKDCESEASVGETNALEHAEKPVRPPRPTVFPTVNVDRFLPVRAKRLRFTVLATNSLEPCIDELEVINPAGQNIALATLGTTVTTSGDTVVADRHEPRFVNDGQYGNSRSWMSNEPGKGWVELEFPAEQEIVRLMWGRDREGKFEDRLATEYRVETATEGDWRLVADSTDRRPWIAGTNRGPAFTTDGLTVEEKQVADRLLDEKRELEARIKVADRGRVAFAGTFRKPDDIHLLSRGDPEQPLEQVVPAVLSAIGNVALPMETDEQDRRKVLADWIASPQNALTARVMVNRIWQWHFGTGFVATPNDFGRNGAKPSHPELLDWLATEFIRSGWSIKHMHRLIVLSATYRQSTSVQSRKPRRQTRTCDSCGVTRHDGSKPRRFAIACSLRAIG